MQPSLGRIVIFNHPNGHPCAALITRVELRRDAKEQVIAAVHSRMPDFPADLVDAHGSETSWDVWISVFVHTSAIEDVQFRGPVPFDESGQTPGTWHWPPRV